MAKPLPTLFEEIRRMVNPLRLDEPDGQLLAEFVANQDQDAFEALVRRHGPRVFAVCRRVIGQTSGADDAFQVTFFALARRARSLQKQQSVGAWLYRVAHRVACQARASEQRRRRVEAAMKNASSVQPDADAQSRELLGALEAELAQLPEKYRAPLLLCGVEEKTHEESARILGQPLGSMSRLLARGRELLRKRLARRGFTIGAGTFALLNAGQAQAAMPAVLLQDTVRNALPFVLKSTIAGATAHLSPTTARLLKKALRAMFWTRGKLCALVLAMGLIGAAVGVSLGLGKGELPGNVRAPREIAQARDEKTSDKQVALPHPGTNLLAGTAKIPAKEDPAVTAIDLGSNNLQVRGWVAGNADEQPGLFVADMAQVMAPPHFGFLCMIGRTPPVSASDRLEVVSFQQIGDRIIGEVKHIYSEPGTPVSPQCYCLGARLWDFRLPPGHYQVEIRFKDYIRNGNEVKPADPKARPRLLPLTCAFDVPEPQAKASQPGALPPNLPADGGMAGLAGMLAMSIPIGNPFRNARDVKVSDYVIYKVTAQGINALPGASPMEGITGSTIKVAVIARDDKTVLIGSTGFVGMMTPFRADVTQPYDVLAGMKLNTYALPGFQLEALQKTGDGKESLNVGDKSYDCTLVKATAQTEINVPGTPVRALGGKITDVKVWASADAPFAGIVKQTSSHKEPFGETCVEIAGWGNEGPGKAAVPGTPPPPGLAAEILASMPHNTMPIGNPFLNAKDVKVGDYVTFKATRKGGTASPGWPRVTTIKVAVVARDDKTVTLRTTNLLGLNLPWKADVTKPYDVVAGMKLNDQNLNFQWSEPYQKTGEGKESVNVGDKSYDCTWVKTTAKTGFLVSLGLGGKYTADMKVWASASAPFAGIVKQTSTLEYKGGTAEATLEITGWGNEGGGNPDMPLPGLVEAIAASMPRDDIPIGNPFLNAKDVKVGDYVTFKATLKGGTPFPGMPRVTTNKVAVVARDDKTVILRTTNLLGLKLPWKADVTKPYDVVVGMRLNDQNLLEVLSEPYQKTSEGKESINVGDKSYDCTWVKATAQTGFLVLLSPGGKYAADMGELTADMKVWASASAPFAGIVKQTSIYHFKEETVEVTVEITGSGNEGAGNPEVPAVPAPRSRRNQAGALCRRISVFLGHTIMGDSARYGR